MGIRAWEEWMVDLILRMKGRDSISHIGKKMDWNLGQNLNKKMENKIGLKQKLEMGLEQFLGL